MRLSRRKTYYIAIPAHNTCIVQNPYVHSTNVDKRLSLTACALTPHPSQSLVLHFQYVMGQSNNKSRSNNIFARFGVFSISLFEIRGIALDQETDNETEESEDGAKDLDDKNLDKSRRGQI